MRINLMTACLTSGDAIGNYIGMLQSAFAGRGEVAVFADRGTRERAFLPSYSYAPTRDDVLWFHYSIGSENFALLREGDPDFKIMDFHGINPPELFSEDEAELRRLAEQALRDLPKFRDVFRLCIVHSDYSARVLREAGYENIVKSPLAISRALAESPEHPYLAERLARIEYVLFVGRVVAQKDVLRAIEVFAKVRERRPKLKMWIVGSRESSPSYQRLIDARIRELGIERDVGFTGKLADPRMLKTFFKYAKLFVMFSRWESFCVPVAEAMGFGVPTVTSEPTVAEIMGEAGVFIQGVHAGSVGYVEIASLLDDSRRYESLRRKCLERAPMYWEENMVRRLREIEREHFPLVKA